MNAEAKEGANNLYGLVLLPIFNIQLTSIKGHFLGCINYLNALELVCINVKLPLGRSNEIVKEIVSYALLAILFFSFRNA